jgi:hypothetical protein
MTGPAAARRTTRVSWWSGSGCGCAGAPGIALFRWESLLNTPLFVSFPGFVSKLWLADDEHGF